MYIHCEDCDATSSLPDNQSDEGNILALTKELHCIYCKSTNITFYDVVDNNVDDDFKFTRCPICKHELEGSVCGIVVKVYPLNVKLSLHSTTASLSAV